MSPRTRRPAATQQEREAAQMINLAIKPLHELETALDAAETLRIMIYTAEPGTQDAERLALLSVIGTQSLAG